MQTTQRGIYFWIGYILRTCAAVSMLLGGLLAVLALPAVQPALAQGSSAGDLIAAVNALRKANGLPAYRTNAKLMAAAQGHSDYQASINSVTHSGAGGNQPRDRAAAAGYGSGATFYISENIAGGMNLSAQEAVGWWMGDSLHQGTMLSSAYTEVGAGVAVSGSTVYYTLDAANIAGEAGSASSGSGPAANPAVVAGTDVPLPTVEVMLAVKVATPKPDGSIVHVVETGQFLLTIATAYKVKLADLLRLNNLTDKAIIYPGDKLLIHAADRTLTASAGATPATPTRRPTRTPTANPPAGTAVALAAPPEQPSHPIASQRIVASRPPSELHIDPVLAAIAGLVFFGTLLILTGGLLRRGS